MKKLLLFAAVAAMMMGACGKKESVEVDEMAKFKDMTDIQRAEYLMHQMPPDSLAQSFINSVLGRSEYKFDTIANVYLYYLENLKNDSASQFTQEYDTYIQTLPLADKLKVYKATASEDETKLGYKLGLEYVSVIRENNMTSQQVEKELQAFRQVCDTDTSMYKRVIKGFQVALEADRGKDVSSEIYNRFRNYE